jgi:hypothetical protein
MISVEQAALVGYEAEHQKIKAKIAELQRQLKGRAGRAAAPVTETPAKRGRRHLSAAAWKRIALAQKQRWAAYRKNQKTA